MTTTTCLTLTGLKIAAKDPTFFPLFGKNAKLAAAVGNLDKLTDAHTAFPKFADFAAAMATGYVPTIYPTCRRKRTLIRAVRALGYRVWTGSNTGYGG